MSENKTVLEWRSGFKVLDAGHLHGKYNYTCMLLFFHVLQMVNFEINAGVHMVVHQSTAKQLLHGKDDVIPLYCVASQHSLSTSYEWDNVAGPVGINSPVIYVTKPGTYRCVVSDAGGKVAYARNIVVTRGEYICVALCSLIP